MIGWMGWGVLVECAIMSAIAGALMWIKKYREGIAGHIGFVLIIFSTVVLWSDILNGEVDYAVDAVSVLLVTGCTLFMMSHFYRYLRYYHFKRGNQPCQDQHHHPNAAR